MSDSEMQHEHENEPDLSSDDMGLCDLTREQIQQIEADANNQSKNPGEQETAPQSTVASPSKKRVREKLWSKAWEHFTKGPVKPDGSYDAKCKYCPKVYEMGNQKSTSSMAHHIKQGCKDIPSAKRHKSDALQRLLQTAKTVGEASPAIWEFNQARCRKSFAKMVIVHEYPFNCVNHHYMEVFLSDVQPQFKLMSRTTLRSDCLKIYAEERNNLYDLISGLDCKVSLTSDLWTSNSRDMGFMSLTCHNIDDSWTIRKRVIGFSSLASPHTGKAIADVIYHRLIKWNMDKKVLCLTLDNATANDVAIRELLSTPLKDTLVVEGNIFHQRCGCHILNLIVQDGLAVLSTQIIKIRETMKYLRHSQARMERFQLAASQAKITHKKPAWDVATRWNSTYLMLELALQLKSAIVRYAALDKRYDSKPSDGDWDAVNALLEYLKVFYDATMKLSGSKYPTLNLFFSEFCEVFLAIKKMEGSPHEFIKAMAKKMFDKWDKYWSNGNALLAIACILDPRCKMAVVEYYIEELYPEDSQGFIRNLKCCLHNLFKEYLEAYSKSVESQASSSSQDVREKSRGSTSVTNTRAGLKNKLKSLKITEPQKSEIDQYLEDPLDETSVDDDFDVLAWWKVNAPKYPVLARLCRDILAVPISTVASEATFSIGGRTLSPIRSSLSDETMEALICAQDWLRACIHYHRDGL